jgi:cAMP-specific phosphodiesterase 4
MRADNFRHAWTVMHTAWLFVAEAPSLRDRGLLRDLDVLALLLAALCHDLEHPGTTNAFQVNTGSALALRYNDASVLENHHAATGAGVIARSRALAPLPPGDAKALRRAMLAAILATDMSSHKTLLASVNARLDGSGGGSGAEDAAAAAATPPGFDGAAEEDRQLLLSFLLHTADLCNPLFPPPMSRRIAEDLSREFAAQAALECAAGMPVSVMLAADDVAKAKMEVGFLGACVRACVACVCSCCACVGVADDKCFAIRRLCCEAAVRYAGARVPRAGQPLPDAHRREPGRVG